MKNFKITFKKTNEAVTEKPVTAIKVNGKIVGHIYPPGYDTHAKGKHHISVNMSVMDSPMQKTLKPVFDTDKEARDYIKEELYNIHSQNSGLYFAKEVKSDDLLD